jgi:hypothetical protein
VLCRRVKGEMKLASPGEVPPTRVAGRALPVADLQRVYRSIYQVGSDSQQTRARQHKYVQTCFQIQLLCDRLVS